ncbi:MAG: nucleotidyltransferase domain-containing protein [Planctomycetes bacterium]|nr:nucleotidyltransferase domain-containing protein [Planctomycetota bacterium]
MRVIRRFAREVAERFHPDQIILFGSHAYGTPHADSDVDVLVVMPARSQIDQACRIDAALDPPFPLDLIVRTPRNLAWRVAEGDSFLREVMARGKVLYEKDNGRVGGQGRGPNIGQIRVACGPAARSNGLQCFCHRSLVHR